MTLTSNSKEGFLCLLLGSFFMWSMSLGGRIVIPDGKISFKLCMDIYIPTYMSYSLQHARNSLQQPETTAENSRSKGRVMELSPNCCFYNTILVPFKTQESWLKRGRKIVRARGTEVCCEIVSPRICQKAYF